MENGKSDGVNEKLDVEIEKLSEENEQPDVVNETLNVGNEMVNVENERLIEGKRLLGVVISSTGPSLFLDELVPSLVVLFVAGAGHAL